jgi:hypothetical protein
MIRPVVYVLTKADMVWNRALSDDPGTGPGDRYLRAMAKPYGRIMNGGVSALMDTCTPPEVHRGADAFDYLGLSDLADLTRRLIDADWYEDGLEERLNHAFYGLDYAHEGAYERKYAESPEDFDPVADDGTDRMNGSWLPDGGPNKVVCPGELTVHEQGVGCTQGDACPESTPAVLHSRSRLHTAAGCERCPSGPTWAGQAAQP